MGLATAVTLASLGLSAKQALDGAQAESKANQAAENAANQAARIQERDFYKELKVPTLGLEKATQNMQAWQQAQIQALKESGAAGVLGGLTAAGQQARAQNQDLAVEAQNAQYQRDLAQAQNAQQIEQGRMQREFAMNQAKLAGAQTAAAEARQNKAAGIQGGISALSNAATLDAYRDIYGNQEENKGPGFLAQLGYSLGLGGTNATPVSSSMVNAQDAFKPTINAMAPSGINPQINNIGAQQAQASLAQSQQLNALRDPQMQFDKAYRWNPYLNQWGLRQ